MADQSKPDLRYVLDSELILTLGLDAMGWLQFLLTLSSPTPDLPGGCAVAISVKDLNRLARMGNDKRMRLTTALTAAGLIYVEPGERYGRGGGSTPDRYWMTFDPNFPSPKGTRRVFATPNDAGLSTTQDRRAHFGNVHSGNRHLTSVREGHPVTAAPETGTQEVREHPDVVDSLSAVSTGVPERRRSQLPEFVRTALRDIGWQGAPPEPSVDPVVLVAVARHLMSSGKWTNPAGQLNKLVSQDKLEDYALLHGLAGTDPTGALGEHVDTAPSEVMMAYPRLCELQNEEPEWFAMVRTEAARLAQMKGLDLSMALIRQVAASIPLPGSQDAAASS